MFHERRGELRLVLTQEAHDGEIQRAASRSPGRIGIDLDNTIIDYDRAFVEGAIDLGFVPAEFRGGKTALRDAVRRGHAGEPGWQQLQALIYGPRIGAAIPYDGVARFIELAGERAVALAIVSHKSTFAAAAPQGPDLRACADAWLRERDLVRGGTIPVYYESSRAEKCARITALGLDVFIDDLVEVFEDPGFPAGVERWLFAPHGAAPHPAVDRVFESWRALCAAVFE